MGKASLEEVTKALGKVRALEAATEVARETEQAAVVELAELVGVRRRDKDTVIDAVVTAERMIIDAAVQHVEGEDRPEDGFGVQRDG